MKNFYLSILFVACGVLISFAQTNTSTNGVDAILALVTTNPPPALAVTNRPPQKSAQGPTTITSKGPLDADLNNHWVTYSDHVRVTDPQMTLTCEWLKSNLPANGEQVTNIVAKTNVIVDFTDEKGQKMHATGDKAVYNFHVQSGVTNETIVLTGNPPQIEQGQNTMTGDAIIWDRATGHVTVTNPKGIFWPNTNTPAATNSSATKTNQPIGPKLF